MQERLNQDWNDVLSLLQQRLELDAVVAVELVGQQSVRSAALVKPAK